MEKTIFIWSAVIAYIAVPAHNAPTSTEFGKPITETQLRIFNDSLSLRQREGHIYDGPSGETYFRIDYATWNTKYCDDLNLVGEESMTPFMTGKFNSFLNLKRQDAPSVFSGDKGKNQLLQVWIDDRAEYCKEALRVGQDMSKPIYPKSETQRSIFQNALEFRLWIGRRFDSDRGKAKFLVDYTILNKNYCTDLKKAPSGPRTKFQTHAWNVFLRMMQTVYPKSYKTDSQKATLKKEWEQTRATYCSEAEKAQIVPKDTSNGPLPEEPEALTGTALTGRQQAIFKDALSLKQREAHMYDSDAGEQRFRTEYAEWNSYYCTAIESVKDAKKSPFIAILFKLELDIYKLDNPAEYAGKEGRRKLWSLWIVERNAYCREANLEGQDLKKPLIPTTRKQKEIYHRALELRRKIGTRFDNEEAKAKYLEEYISVHDDYCVDLKEAPRGPKTEFQENVWIYFLRMMNNIYLKKYDTEEREAALENKWDKTRRAYCSGK